MSADIRLYPFQCGATTIPLRNHILGAGLAGEMITTPVTWFLLTHPRGNVIIDGGNPAEVAIPELEHWGKILEMSSVEMAPDEEVTVALERNASTSPASAGSCRATSTSITRARSPRSIASRTRRCS
jgi:N-acyl homoserine lactone hydrolase